MKLDEYLRTLLVHFGHAGEIYNAMDTEDLVEMVKAADRALSKLNGSKDDQFGSINKKSLDKSKISRAVGNDYYSSGKMQGALIAYNIAIANAHPGSLEMILAVSNRSAVLFALRSFRCASDIQICLAMGSPPYLAKKLNKRMLEAQKFVEIEILRNMAFSSQFISTFFKSGFKNNKDVSSASSDVAFITNDGVRQITAKRQISPGKIVAIEPAFVTCDHNEYVYLSCYYCNKLILNPSPCPKCCYAMFCTEECLNLCMSDYHSIECQIVDLLENIYSDPKNSLIVKAAIKLSLKLGWDGFIAASENIGSSRMKVASTREAYSVDEPLSMLSYDDSQELMEGRMFNGSVLCAIVLQHFDKVPNYFPKESAKRASAKKAMSKIMLHLYVHFTNTVFFRNAAYEYKSEVYRPDMQISMGWFSMSSKLKHSCQPNLLVVGLNDHIALVSLRTIEEGEELTISFIEHFLDISNIKEITNFSRPQHLFWRTKKMCSCNVCMEDWSVSDLKYEPMTNRQANLNRRFQSVGDIFVDKDSFMLVCEILDTFAIKSKQYYDAYRSLKRFLSLCQCKLSNNRCCSEE